MKITAAFLILAFSSLATAQVTSVAGRTGDVYLNVNDIAGLGEYLGNLPMPVALADMNANMIQYHAVSPVSPSNGQVLVWDETTSMWTPGSCGDMNERVRRLEERVQALEAKLHSPHL